MTHRFYPCRDGALDRGDSLLYRRKPDPNVHKIKLRTFCTPGGASCAWLLFFGEPPLFSHRLLPALRMSWRASSVTPLRSAWQRDPKNSDRRNRRSGRPETATMPHLRAAMIRFWDWDTDRTCPAVMMIALLIHGIRGRSSFQSSHRFLGVDRHMYIERDPPHSEPSLVAFLSICSGPFPDSVSHHLADLPRRTIRSTRAGRIGDPSRFGFRDGYVSESSISMLLLSSSQ